MSKPSERELVADWRRGVQAIEELYRRYRGAMLRKAYAVLKNEQDAEDVVQDIFTSLLLRARTFDPNKGTFKAWAVAVIENDCCSILERRKQSPVISLDAFMERGGDVIDPGRDPLEILIEQEEQEEQQDQARRALDRLTPKQRQAVELKAKGLSGREIAEEMGINYSAAKMNLSRARANVTKR